MKKLKKEIVSGSRQKQNREHAFVVKLLIYIIFIISGATALVYETAWMRMLSLTMGSTNLSGTLILSVFFSGLALGSFLFGRIVDRFGKALLIYALLELFLGVFALFSVQLLHGCDSLFLQLQRSGMTGVFFSAVQFAVLWLLLLPATVLMGGTLPVMSKYLVRSEDTCGRLVGRLYGWNTVGAVFGTALTAFVLIRAIGISATVNIAACSNIVLGVLVLLLIRAQVFRPAQSQDIPESELAKPKPSLDKLQVQILFVVFVSGLTALGLEVLWFRIFSISLDSSVQSFGIVLSTFIAGFALGSIIFAAVADKSRKPLYWISGLFIVSACLLFLTIPWLDELPMWYYNLLREHSDGWMGSIFFRYLVSIGVLIPLTTLMGGVFPIAVALFVQRLPSVGADIGRVYAWNTVGAIIGSMLAGLVLLPFLGTRTAFMIIVSVIALTGYWVYFISSKGEVITVRLLPMAPLLLVFVISLQSGPWNPGRMIIWWGGPVDNSSVLYYEEGSEGNVAVVRHDGANSLFSGKKLVASDSPETKRHLGLLAHIPLLLHAQPENVLVIGLATGITLNETLAHNIKQADCVDINPLMKNAVQFFKQANDDVFHNRRVQIEIADARHFIRAKSKVYDCITTDPIHPADAHSNNLYAREFYQLAAAALKDGGIMCQWLPTGDLATVEIKRIIATFSEVFAHVSLWIPNLSDLVIIGSAEPYNVDLQLIRKRFKDPDIVAGAGRYMETPNLENFISLFFLGPKALADFSSGVNINSDDHPILEYEAPRNLWNLANLPNLYHELSSHWSDSFAEFWSLVPAEQQEPAIKLALEKDYEINRRQTLELVAYSITVWCRDLEERGELRRAFDEYERMFSLFPETLNPALLDAAIAMSIIQERFGNQKLAKDYYTTAITMAPDETISRNIAARAFIDHHMYTRAQKEWQLILAADPQNREALHGLQWLRSQGLASGIRP